MATFTEFNRIGVRTVEARGTDGNISLYTQCANHLDGTPMNNSKVDGDIYIKVGYEYFKKNDVSEAVVPDPTFTDDSFDI